MGNKLGSTLAALVFLIAFGGIGAGASYGIVSMFRQSLAAEDWVLVQAKVDDAALKASRGSKGGNTYYADGAYRYAFNGKEYVSTRLGFNFLDGSDNIGDWQENMASFLQEAKTSGKSVPVYVNPDNPAEAVVDRDVRWPMVIFMGVFAVIFGGVGVGALVGLSFIWFGGSDKAKKKREKRTHRQRDVTTVEGSAAGAGFLWVFALLWNAIAWPAALLIVPQVIASGEWAGLLILLFPLVGLLVLWSAIATTWKALFGGGTQLTLVPAQPQQGARFSGYVRYGKGAKPGAEYVVRLTWGDAGANMSRVARWWKDLPARAIPDPEGGVRVPFQFDPPARVSGATLNVRENTSAWRITVTRKKGGGVGEEFPIEMLPPEGNFEDIPPVLPTAEERHNVQALEKAFGAAAAAKLTPEQRAAFADMPPQAQAMAVAATKHGGTIGKVLIGIFVLLFVIGLLT